jgi:hypothetical protein
MKPVLNTKFPDHSDCGRNGDPQCLPGIHVEAYQLGPEVGICIYNREIDYLLFYAACNCRNWLDGRSGGELWNLILGIGLYR